MFLVIDRTGFTEKRRGWGAARLFPLEAPLPRTCRSTLAFVGCCKKGAPNPCKHNFPKVLNARQRVICRGNARRFRLSTAGRRNALGPVLNLRQSEWLSGSVRAFAVMLLGNSHTGVNFRVSLCDASHDPTCTRNCLSARTLHKLQRLMQIAARRSTKYFTGYLQMPQLGMEIMEHQTATVCAWDITNNNNNQ